MMLLYMYQIFSFLRSHLLFFVHFFFTFMEYFFCGHPIFVPVLSRFILFIVAFSSVPIHAVWGNSKRAISVFFFWLKSIVSWVTNSLPNRWYLMDGQKHGFIGGTTDVVIDEGTKDIRSMDGQMDGRRYEWVNGKTVRATKSLKIEDSRLLER